MGDDAIADAWIESSSGIAAGETTIRWYAEYCTANSRSVVADRRTEHEAISAALEWDLPIVQRSPSLRKPMSEHSTDVALRKDPGYPYPPEGDIGSECRSPTATPATPPSPSV